jgi:hypothetical protein
MLLCAFSVVQNADFRDIHINLCACKIYILNFSQNDRPPTHAGSASPPPTELHVAKTTVVHGEDGIFHVQGMFLG